MPPTLARANLRNDGLVYAELCGQLLLHFASRIPLSNRDNRFGIQFCTIMPFTMRMPPLLKRIAHVVHLCSKKQVIRIYASWIVALVQHKNPRRNRPICVLPRHAMRRSPSSVSIIEAAIPESFCSACPEPAGFGLVHKLPEVPVRRPQPIALVRTVFSTACNQIRLRSERIAALHANTRHASKMFLHRKHFLSLPRGRTFQRRALTLFHRIGGAV